VGGAFSAAGAFFRIDIPGFCVHRGRKVAFLSFKSLDLTIGQDLDI
jgi:hypothetical protein